MIKGIWEFRHFIVGLVKKDFKSRYMNSLLGSLWAVINPLAMIIVYTVIFSEIMMAKIPGVDDKLAYSIYLCAGILTWQFFLETTSRMNNMFIDFGNILKKANFPRSTLPASVVLSSAVNFMIVFAIYLIFLLITNHFPWESILSIIPVLIIMQMYAVGIGMIVAVLNVFFRDIGQLIGVVLQFLFWLTPIVYTIEIIPKEFKWIFEYNFMFPLISTIQNIFLYNTTPDWVTLLPSLIISALLMIIGFIIYKKLESEMVDEL